MDFPTENNVPRKWLAACFLLIALILALAYLAFGTEFQQLTGETATTDAEMRADLEKSLGGFKTYQALKELYPEAYEELIGLIIKDMRDGTDMKQAIIDGAEFTTKLRRDNAQYYAMASLPRLRLSLSAQIPQFSYLKTAYGFKACNELAVHGGVAIVKTLGTDFLKDQTLTQMMDEATGFFFRTTAEGRELKLTHAQPTTADWQVTADYLKSKGMTEVDLKLVIAPTQHVDDAQLCDAIIKLYENITTMDNDAAERIVPSLAAAAAAG